MKNTGSLLEAVHSVLWAHKAAIGSAKNLESDILEELRSLSKTLEAKDYQADLRGVFEYRVERPEIAATTYQEREIQTEALRRQKLAQYLPKFDDNSLLEFSSRLKNAYGFGFMVAELLDDRKWAALVALTVAPLEKYPSHFLEGLIVQRVVVDQMPKALLRLTYPELQDLEPKSRSILLQCYPSTEETWRTVETAGTNVHDHYWGHRLHLASESVDLIWQAVRKFLEARRPFTALDTLMGLIVRKSEELAKDPGLAAKVLEAAAIAGPSEDDPIPMGDVSWSVDQLLTQLREGKLLSTEEISHLEIAWLSALGVGTNGPVTTLGMVKESPEGFVELLKHAYRGHNEPQRELDARGKAAARAAYHILGDLEGLFGASENLPTEEEFRAWISKAREMATQLDRIDVCDVVIGQSLALSPNGEDKNFPHEMVRRLIEDLRSESLESGFSVGVHNSRGTFTKSLDEGGQQERTIAQKYSELAEKFKVEWPRTAALMHKIARSYHQDAEREDQRRDLDR